MTTHINIEDALYAWRAGEISLGKLKECMRAAEAGEEYNLPALGELSPEELLQQIEILKQQISRLERELRERANRRQDKAT